MKNKERVAIFGGTFDPVHNGHLCTALELVHALELDSVSLMPCGIHPHNKQPKANSEQRLEMLQLATLHEQTLSIDTRELEKEGASYTIDSCKELRKLYGDNACIGFIIGTDVLSGLHRWKDWKHLLNFVNLIVVERFAEKKETITSVRLDNDVELLLDKAIFEMTEPKGQIIKQCLTPWIVSSTEVRKALSDRTDMNNHIFLEQMLPKSVYEYIRNENLYT